MSHFYNIKNKEGLNMGEILSRLKDCFRKSYLKEITMVGLDGAGKTTILYQMKISSTVETIPTIGFNVESFNVGKTKFNVWDIGGQDAIRPLWNHYVEMSRGIIFVVDIIDSNRWKSAGKALGDVVRGMERKPVLILANKADDPNDPCLNQKVQTMVEDLGVKDMNIIYEVFHCSAIQGPNNPNPLERLVPAFEWIGNTLGLIYKCSVEIIPYVITWDGIVTKYHKTYLKRLQIPINVEAYIQSIVLKKTVEMISFDRRRGIESGPSAEESWERASLSVIIGAEMHKQPTPPLKEVKNEEDSVKQVNSKNILSLILDDVTRPEEPTIDINDKSDVEKENKVVKVMEEINTASLPESVNVYKYLRIIKDSRSNSTFERLCHTRFKAKKSFPLINQHSISLINDQIGVLRLDDAVRVVLVKNEMYLSLAIVGKIFCYFQDRNLFWGAEQLDVRKCSSINTPDGIMKQILENEHAEIRVDIRLKTDVKIRNNRLDVFTFDKKKNKITLIELGITSQDLLQIKTVKTISFNQPREPESDPNAKASWKKATMCVIQKDSMHYEPTTALKQGENDENGGKELKTKNNAPPISKGGTRYEEMTINIKEESDLEEEAIVVKEVKSNY
ncbi:ADP-ribosylation factor [Hamiltosporidium tvaerminnensis]|uniref:ADP-ribosylation factor n=2 Tax=Hamiltosporidium tvaerminnensis TaxID=1176355 RepID=A0A4Q9LUJ3_9MICR|nr:ADP-ribosylation factor [Hamiltosporidium tvaerminnensis]